LCHPGTVPGVRSLRWRNGARWRESRSSTYPHLDEVVLRKSTSAGANANTRQGTARTLIPILRTLLSVLVMVDMAAAWPIGPPLGSLMRVREVKSGG
jgi:hypothetical protein